MGAEDWELGVGVVVAQHHHHQQQAAAGGRRGRRAARVETPAEFVDEAGGLEAREECLKWLGDNFAAAMARFSATESPAYRVPWVAPLCVAALRLSGHRDLGVPAAGGALDNDEPVKLLVEEHLLHMVDGDPELAVEVCRGLLLLACHTAVVTSRRRAWALRAVEALCDLLRREDLAPHAASITGTCLSVLHVLPSGPRAAGVVPRLTWFALAVPSALDRMFGLALLAESVVVASLDTLRANQLAALERARNSGGAATTAGGAAQPLELAAFLKSDAVAEALADEAAGAATRGELVGALCEVVSAFMARSPDNLAHWREVACEVLRFAQPCVTWEGVAYITDADGTLLSPLFAGSGVGSGGGGGAGAEAGEAGVVGATGSASSSAAAGGGLLGAGAVGSGSAVGIDIEITGSEAAGGGGGGGGGGALDAEVKRGAVTVGPVVFAAQDAFLRLVSLVGEDAQAGTPAAKVLHSVFADCIANLGHIPSKSVETRVLWAICEVADISALSKASLDRVLAVIRRKLLGVAERSALAAANNAAADSGVLPVAAPEPIDADGRDVEALLQALARLVHRFPPVAYDVIRILQEVAQDSAAVCSVAVRSRAKAFMRLAEVASAAEVSSSEAQLFALFSAGDAAAFVAHPSPLPRVMAAWARAKNAGLPHLPRALRLDGGAAAGAGDRLVRPRPCVLTGAGDPVRVVVSHAVSGGVKPGVPVVALLSVSVTNVSGCDMDTPLRLGASVRGALDTMGAVLKAELGPVAQGQTSRARLIVPLSALSAASVVFEVSFLAGSAPLTLETEVYRLPTLELVRPLDISSAAWAGLWDELGVRERSWQYRVALCPGVISLRGRDGRLVLSGLGCDDQEHTVGLGDVPSLRLLTAGAGGSVFSATLAGRSLFGDTVLISVFASASDLDDSTLVATIDVRSPSAAVIGAIRVASDELTAALFGPLASPSAPASLLSPAPLSESLSLAAPAEDLHAPEGGSAGALAAWERIRAAHGRAGTKGPQYVRTLDFVPSRSKPPSLLTDQELAELGLGDKSDPKEGDRLSAAKDKAKEKIGDAKDKLKAMAADPGATAAAAAAAVTGAAASAVALTSSHAKRLKEAAMGSDLGAGAKAQADKAAAEAGRLKDAAMASSAGQQAKAQAEKAAAEADRLKNAAMSSSAGQQAQAAAAQAQEKAAEALKQAKMLAKFA